MPSNNLLDRILASAKLSKKETVKQQRILQSAIALFAEKGYANTSTSEIAKLSGVAEGTIFRHYGTKENLLLSAIVPFLKESFPVLAQELFEDVHPSRQAGFKEFIRALYLNRLHFLRENKEIFRVVVKEFVYRDELREELLAYAKQGLEGNLFRAMDHYKAMGELPDRPNAQILNQIVPYFFSRFVIRFVLSPVEPEIDDDTEADAVAEFIAGGLGFRRS